MDEGFCRWTISDKRQLVTEKNPLIINEKPYTWWELRHSTVRLPAHSWAEIKKFIIKICKESELCAQNVSSWDRAVSDIDFWLKENNR
jgi:hypothetical protein